MGSNNKLIINNGINIAGYLRSVRKSSDVLCPLLEALSNSWEAFDEETQNKKISVIISRPVKDLNGDIYGQTVISVLDNGSGFTDVSFSRFTELHDDTKAKANKGTGRLQFIKFFEKVIIESVYSDNGKKYHRDIEFSARKEFVQQNALIKSGKPFETNEPIHTKVSFFGFIDEKDNTSFNNLTLLRIRNQIIKRFIVKGAIQSSIPTIIITDSENESITINKSSFPSVFRENSAYIPLFDSSQKPTGTETEITIKSYLFDEKTIDQSSIFLASKGETIQTIQNTCFKTSDTFLSNQHMVFIVEGSIIDSNISDNRESVFLPNKVQAELFNKWPSIYLDDLIDIVNKAIKEYYPEIQIAFDEHQKRIIELQETFNIDSELLNDVTVNVNDPNSVLLEKIYRKEAKKQAQLDAVLLEKQEKVKKLDSRSDSFQSEILHLAEDINNLIPQQNKELLSKYVTRRKIVLEMLKTILHKDLDCQNGVRNEDERLIHNVLFKQNSSNPAESNLWVLDDSYLYYQGSSDTKLKDICINNEHVFSSEIDGYESPYINGRLIKRPDVLLFPEEGKCIILEFKAPNVDISDYITQPVKYASWIYSFCKKPYCFNMFYVYLIGEDINVSDVTGADAYFEPSENYDFAFLRYRPIANVLNPLDRRASMYMEVINYSSIVQRASDRNRAFFDCLLNPKSNKTQKGEK